MKANEYFEKSEYSKIYFGSNPKLFTEKELIDFAEDYHREQVAGALRHLLDN